MPTEMGCLESGVIKLPEVDWGHCSQVDADFSRSNWDNTCSKRKQNMEWMIIEPKSIGKL